jgi:hypothetical protein
VSGEFPRRVLYEIGRYGLPRAEQNRRECAEVQVLRMLHTSRHVQIMPRASPREESNLNPRLVRVFVFVMAASAPSLGLTANWLEISSSYRLDLDSIQPLQPPDVVQFVVEDGSGPPTTSTVDCTTRLVATGSYRDIYVPPSSYIGFAANLACRYGAPSVYKPEDKPAFCRGASPGYEKAVCGEPVVALHARESAFLGAKALAKCQNKVDVLRYQYRWELEANRCNDKDCADAMNSKRDDVNVTILNSTTVNGMCALPGQSTTAPETIPTKTDKPAEHAQVAYTLCAYKAAADLDDDISPAAQIASAVLSKCHDDAMLWGYAVGGWKNSAMMVQALQTGPYNTTIVLETRAKKREAPVPAPSKKKPQRPNAETL